MADKKVTQLTQVTAPANTDLLLLIDDPAGTPVSTKVEVEDLFGASNRVTMAAVDIEATGNVDFTATSFNVDATTTIVTNGVVINESGEDNDTRIESADSANAFFVDASTNRVGVLNNDPTDPLDVNGNSIRLRVGQTPASGNNTAVGWPVGRIAYDSQYLYVAANTTHILRAALSTF